MEERIETLGEVAWDVLQRIARERLARRPGGHLIEASLDKLDLRLALDLRGDDGEPARFARRLVAAIDQILDDAVQHAAAFRPGHAWCHRCQQAACEHSRPPTGRHVFVGYGPTGTPAWEDFAQQCLDLRHPDVDRLYENPPAFLTLHRGRDALQGGVLDAFQAPHYDLLGQISAGFFRVPSRADEGRGVLALTFQAAASHSRRGGVRYGLNLIGRTPSGEPLDLLWERQQELPWRKALRWAQGALQSLSRPAARRRRPLPRERVDERIDGILRGLARRLERDQRARGRRTRHAEQRHASGERPTRKAVEDAREARDESFKVDDGSGTLVVLGERGRTHFFSREGQLVSSVRYSRDAIARKIRLERWREATVEERELLRRRLADEDGGVDRPSPASDSA